MKLRISIIIVVLFILGTLASGCVGNSTPTTTSSTTSTMPTTITTSSTTSTTTHPSALNTSSSQSANGLSISLSLDSATYQPGQGITIILDELNTLPIMTNMPKSENWVYDHFRRGPCDFISPFGAAIFRGDYTASNYSSAPPLTIYDPHATLTCPTNAPVISYSFEPSSDTANVIEDSNNPGNNYLHFNYEVTIKGYWPDNDYNSNSKLTSFEPGVYTVVAGDEWGALVVLHFTITQ